MRCSYCTEITIGYDALGLPVCQNHIAEADEYVKQNSSKGEKAITNGELIFPIPLKEWFEDNYILD